MSSGEGRKRIVDVVLTEGPAANGRPQIVRTEKIQRMVFRRVVVQTVGRRWVPRRGLDPVASMGATREPDPLPVRFGSLT